VRTGAWLASLARRLLHDDIDALIVSPAIADLQFEGGTSPWRRARAYAGVWRALGGALLFQATSGIEALRADDARLIALRYDTFMVAGLLLVQAVYYTGLALLFFDLQH
jgi:hypothetical protein